MKTIAAREAKNGFGRMLDTVQREPVTIAKNGRPVAVVLSVDEYQRFEALDDAYWATRAIEAAREGFIGADASAQLTEDLLKAED